MIKDSSFNHEYLEDVIAWYCVLLEMIRATMTNTVVVTFSGGHQTPWRHHGFLYKPTFSFSAMQDRPADTQVLV